MRPRPAHLLGLLVAVLCTLLVGCQTDDNATNASARPWNTPKGWEGGFPAGLTEGR